MTDVEGLSIARGEAMVALRGNGLTTTASAHEEGKKDNFDGQKVTVAQSAVLVDSLSPSLKESTPSSVHAQAKQMGWCQTCRGGMKHYLVYRPAIILNKRNMHL